MLELIIGGLARLAPEVLKTLDRSNERKHELALVDANIRAEDSRAKNAQDELSMTHDAANNAAELQALIEATKAQAQEAQGTWAAGFSAMIRPMMATQWVLCLWPSVVVAGFVLSVHQGTPPLIAMSTAFGESERALAQAIAAFWLVDRSLRRV
jgi:hypothetical protein